MKSAPVVASLVGIIVFALWYFVVLGVLFEGTGWRDVVLGISLGLNAAGVTGYLLGRARRPRAL